MADPRAEEYRLSIFQPLLRFVREHHGVPALEQIAHGLDLSVQQLLNPDCWLTFAQQEDLLARCYEVIGDEKLFRQASGHRLRENFGPLIVILRALSVQKSWESSVRSMKSVCKVGEYHIAESTRTSVVAVYTSKYRESRLTCLNRMGFCEIVPTLFNLPVGTIKETSCIARGDAQCTYHISWYERPSWLPLFLGTLTGTALAAATFMLFREYFPWVAAAPLLGGTLGRLGDLVRTNRLNLAYSERLKEDTQELADEATSARHEILELNRRQQDWSEMLEEQVGERTAMLQGVVERVKKLREQRASSLRGFSHDLRNPLAVLRSAHFCLSQGFDAGPDTAEILTDMEEALGQMDRLLRELLESATAESGLMTLTPERLEIEPLAERLRRRLKALVHGREIRVTVFATREVPDHIQTDLLLFDRVVDNLLTNAAKYTERGSIIVEVSGMPGQLCLKVSDSGAGIGSEAIAKVFRPRDPGVKSDRSDSYGVGLSVVVRLLDQIGGHIEVMSRPDLGTTFWAYFPVQLPTRLHVAQPRNEENLDEIIGRVVTIRRASQP